MARPEYTDETLSVSTEAAAFIILMVAGFTLMERSSTGDDVLFCIGLAITAVGGALCVWSAHTKKAKK